MSLTLERVASCDGAAAGIAAADGGVLFSAVDEGRILRFDPGDGGVSEFRRYTSRIKGLARSADGLLYAAQSGSRRVVRLDPEGSTIMLVERLGGRIHNHPADLSVDGLGRVWFSDPHDAVPAPGAQVHGDLDHASVLRLGRNHRREWTLSRMTYDTSAPYGVQVSADSRELFVTENDPAGRREVRAYPIHEDGSLGPYRVLLTFGEDPHGVHRGAYGMCLHGDDLLVCAGGVECGPGPGVYRMDSRGRIAASYPIREDPVSCATLDGALYVTTEQGGLYRGEGL